MTLSKYKNKNHNIHIKQIKISCQLRQTLFRKVEG